ncbi:MAG: type pili twitching motility protein PilT [Naasia sp.]|uniref:type IV pilus twitching motility protein PilT n=1 Tax=Naasia sp. TaxID=2546198 RepID=UPI00261AA8C0|nr:type IV pilus twitching motility protein PilT [Naasia sp.]MCU1570076.1 type pili twitching motility protein PilT [Naasia sp.]
MNPNPKFGVHGAALTSAPPTPSSPLLDAVAFVRDAGGSDLHLAADAVPRVRIDGALAPLPSSPPWAPELLVHELRRMMTDAEWARFETERELDFSWQAGDGQRLRVNVYRQRGSIGAAIRLVPSEVQSVRRLGLPESVEALADLPRGLVLVTGPTGSGKSATLAALLDRVNSTRDGHILTIEDPIEVVHAGKRSVVTQREIDRDTRDYASALRQALRQDPDVIFLGELRDKETISVALSAAETGHLVLATMHTSDAPSAIDRIIDVFPGTQQEQVRAQLALTLRGVVAQTLLPRALGSGRVVAAEVLLVTPAIANLVRQGKVAQIRTAMGSGADLGMQTLDQALADLVDRGAVDAAAALRVAHDPDLLGRMLAPYLLIDAALGRTA